MKPVLKETDVKENLPTSCSVRYEYSANNFATKKPDSDRANIVNQRITIDVDLSEVIFNLASGLAYYAVL